MHTVFVWGMAKTLDEYKNMYTITIKSRGLKEVL